MSNYIDSVIAEFRERFTYSEVPYIVKAVSAAEYEQFISEKLKEQEAMYEEAIGENEVLEKSPASHEDFESIAYENGWRVCRNRLRDEIRQAVNKAKGEV